MSLEKRSMVDLAYNVVPAWSRYIVSAIFLSIGTKPDFTDGHTLQHRILIFSKLFYTAVIAGIAFAAHS